MKRSGSVLVVVLVCCWGAWPGPVHAEERSPASVFGAQGGLVIGGSMGLNKQSYSDTPATSFAVSLRPSVDYFVLDDVAVGGSAFVSYSTYRSGIDLRSKSLGLGGYLNVSFNLPLTRLLSVWPKVYLGAWRQAYEYTTNGTGYTVSIDGIPIDIYNGARPKETAVVVGLFAPVLVHLAGHFFIGFGPDVYADLSHDVDGTQNRRLYLGMSSTVGGWL
jgi:hypothetical protein